MKGEALITIKTKDGKVKQQVKQTNLVFDIPKHFVKRAIEEADLGMNDNETVSGYSESTYHSINYPSSSNNDTVVCYATLYEEWFRAIKINDELCSTTDFKDFKIPQLTGGEMSSIDTNNKRYAYIDTANSSKNGNVLKKSYTWNDCPAFTIRSINLCNYCNASNYAYGNLVTVFGLTYVKKYGKFYFLTNGYQEYARKGLRIGDLAEKTTFNWSLGSGRKAFSVKNLGYRNFSSSNVTYFYHNCITPLRNNEIAILRKVDNVTDNDTDNQVKYLHIIDATDGTLKRSFPLTQFDGFVGYNSSNHYIYYYYARIIATEFGSFLVMSHTNSPDNLYIYKIPEQSEMANYSNNETISAYADLTSIGWSNASNGKIAINEYLLDVVNKKVLKINDDTSTPYTLIERWPFNGGGGSSANATQIENKFGEFAFGDDFYPKWYNTTVLNLSEGVEVSQGDTVTIEYTITAN